jgi:hypothetical protein
LFDFLLSTDKKVKNSVKSPELESKGLAAQIFLGLL